MSQNLKKSLKQRKIDKVLQALRDNNDKTVRVLLKISLME